MIKKLLIALGSLILGTGLLALIIYSVHLYRENALSTHLTQTGVIACLLFCVGMPMVSLIYDVLK